MRLQIAEASNPLNYSGLINDVVATQMRQTYNRGARLILECSTLPVTVAGIESLFSGNPVPLIEIRIWRWLRIAEHQQEMRLHDIQNCLVNSPAQVGKIVERAPGHIYAASENEVRSGNVSWPQPKLLEKPNYPSLQRRLAY